MNWKQELYDEITAIDGLNANPATLVFRISSGGIYDDLRARQYELRRDVKVKAPTPINSRLIDGNLYRAGDFVCKISFAQLKYANAEQASDPPIIFDGVRKTLPDLRDFSESGNYGIALGVDALEVAGAKWTIVGTKADKWLDGEPAVIELILRK